MHAAAAPVHFLRPRRHPAPTTTIPLQPEVASPLPRHVCRASSGKRAAPGPRPSHAQGPWMRQRPAQQAPKNDLYRDLFSALATQVRLHSTPLPFSTQRHTPFPSPFPSHHQLALSSSTTAAAAASSSLRTGARAAPRSTAKPKTAIGLRQPKRSPRTLWLPSSSHHAQFAKESLPWIKELVEPLWAGNPEPLTDTLAPEELADADSQFSTINNVKIHYKTWTMAEGEAQPLGRSVAQRGDEEAPAVLMLHGFNGSVFNWRLVAQEVAEGVSGAAAGAACTSVAFDRPPFGLSGRPVKWEHGSKTDPYTLSGGVELVRSIIKQLGLKRVVLVGHSSGAPIALEVAAQCPELVAGLVLVAPAVAVDSKGFLSTLDFGMIARFAWTRMLLSFDGPGVAYVRQQIRKREEEVRQGKFGVYADDSMFATPQVRHCGYPPPISRALPTHPYRD